LARLADAPPVPTATITGERSTIAGTVKSHSAGRSTTLTSRPWLRSRVASALDQPRLGLRRGAGAGEENALAGEAEEDGERVHRLRP